VFVGYLVRECARSVRQRMPVGVGSLGEEVLAVYTISSTYIAYARWFARSLWCCRFGDQKFVVKSGACRSRLQQSADGGNRLGTAPP
jgi:hypothetical protein